MECITQLSIGQIHVPERISFVLNFGRSTVKHAFQNTQNDCQWYLYNAPNSFSSGLCPDTAGEAYSAPQAS